MKILPYNTGIQSTFVEFINTDVSGNGGGLLMKNNTQINNFGNDDEIEFNFIIKFNSSLASDFDNMIIFNKVKDTEQAITNPANVGIILYSTITGQLKARIFQLNYFAEVSFENFIDVDNLPNNKWRKIKFKIGKMSIFLCVDNCDDVIVNKEDIYDFSETGDIRIGYKDPVLISSSVNPKFKILGFNIKKNDTILTSFNFDIGRGNFVFDNSSNQNYLKLENMASWNLTNESIDFNLLNK